MSYKGFLEMTMETGTLPPDVMNAYAQQVNERRFTRTFYCENTIEIPVGAYEAERIEQARREVAASIASSLWQKDVEVVAYQFEEPSDRSYIEGNKRVVVGVLVAFTDLNSAPVGGSVHLSAFQSSEDVIELVEPNDTFRRFRRVNRGQRPGAWVRVV